MTTTRFSRGDLVQLRHEYEVMGNPSLFRIRSIRNGEAVLGQLSSDDDSYCGLDTTIAIDDPDLMEPVPEVLDMYRRHVR